MVLVAGMASAAEPTPMPTHEIKDPHYGDALFQFFQDRYFTSITTLMVSQQAGRVAHHADEAEVLRGGMLLSYGMPREAGQIFTTLIDKGAEPKVRDRAWYFLAKIRYQRGYLAEAEEALARVGHALPPELEEERGLLQANLLMARSDYAGAAAVLGGIGGVGAGPATGASGSAVNGTGATANNASGNGLLGVFGAFNPFGLFTRLSGPPPKSAGLRYARFNLGVALIKSGDPAHGMAVLDALGRGPAENEEYRSLRDRANVALGYAALADHQPKAARSYLERVRLQSPQADKALLGFGWAADAMEQPRLALVPWTELAQREAGDAAVLEAQIAVPYAYGELGAYGQALDRYNDAIAMFAHEDVALGESIATIRSAAWVDGLIERNPADEMGWFWSLSGLPALPHPGHMTQVLARHEFQEALKNYRDLRFLEKNLNDWRDKLAVFDDMLATRRKAYAERLPQVRERASEIGLGALRQRRDALAAEVARGEAGADGLAFADAKQLALLQRVSSVRAALESMADAAPAAAVDAREPAPSAGMGAAPPAPVGASELSSARERARLAAGVLTWQLAQDYPARAWEAKKALRDVADGVAEAERRDAALAQAQRDEPARFERFAARIAAIAPVLQALIPRVTALAGEQQRAVQDIAVAELARQQERLAAYSTQARFAVAQLYDRAQERAEGRAESKNAEADHGVAAR